MAFQTKYKPGDVLGSGAFATVQLVTNVETGEQYAAKVALDHRDSRKAFKKEVDIYKILDHGPSVTNMIEFFGKPDCVIILEFQSGGDLFDEIVKRNHYSENDARKACFQLLTAIKFMHDQGIAHLDLKPENVLLDAEFNLKVTDFGEAKTFNVGSPKKDVFKDFAGTPEYMATEMHKHPRKSIKYSEIVDEFAVGVILYILLTGYPPYQSQTDRPICKLYWREKDWEDLEPSSENLVVSLMEKDPSKRLTAGEAMKHEWFANIVGETDMKETRERLTEFKARQKFKLGLLLISISLEAKKLF